MSHPILLPKLGNTVETCIIERWHKQVGDTVAVGDILCDVETDKATLEVESTAAGTLLALHFAEGDEVVVLATIATVGDPGETGKQLALLPTQTQPGAAIAISPRARKLATQHNASYTDIVGTGPNGRIIERDVQARLVTNSASESEQSITNQPAMTPVAKRMVERGGFQAPEQGSGPKGRIMRRDLGQASPPIESEQQNVTICQPDDTQSANVTVIPVKSARRVIAQRMLQATQTTAPFTIHRYADARALKTYRQRLKSSPPELGLNQITLNELVLFATIRTLTQHPELNAYFLGNEIHQFGTVDLAFAVDTPRGLLVPVIRRAEILTLHALANEGKRLGDACLSGNVSPDELTGGTFTVSNLGSLGVETFTPVLNLPQVGILGIGNISLRPIEEPATDASNMSVQFVPQIALSLTIDHQAVDGAPAARFLGTLAMNLANIDILTAGK